MSEPLVYYPIFPDPDELGSERTNDVRKWVELLISSGIATEDEELANAYMVVGGDSRLMKAVREKHENKKVFFGVNRGTIGFLLNPIDCINAIPRTTDEINIVSVRLLGVRFTERNGRNSNFLAFNDAFCGGSVADFITFKIEGSLNHFPSREVTGNGIVISTPQGTTGYALKARGSSAVLPLDTNNWFISGVATGPYPCDQVTPQKILVTVTSRKPVNGYADGYDQEVKDIESMFVVPSEVSVNLGFITGVDLAARRTRLAQKLERGITHDNAD